jgi:hypothetical protein
VIVKAETVDGTSIEVHEDRQVGGRRYWAKVDGRALEQHGRMRLRRFTTVEAAWRVALEKVPRRRSAAAPSPDIAAAPGSLRPRAVLAIDVLFRAPGRTLTAGRIARLIGDDDTQRSVPLMRDMASLCLVTHVSGRSHGSRWRLMVEGPAPRVPGRSSPLAVDCPRCGVAVGTPCQDTHPKHALLWRPAINHPHRERRLEAQKGTAT